MERILIIDDEQRIRRLIPELFESGDYSFESARTGAELVLSAKVYPPDRRKALELGADDFLEKPFRIDELTAAVEKRLARIS